MKAATTKAARAQFVNPRQTGGGGMGGAPMGGGGIGGVPMGGAPMGGAPMGGGGMGGGGMGGAPMGGGIHAPGETYRSFDGPFPFFTAMPWGAHFPGTKSANLAKSRSISPSVLSAQQRATSFRCENVSCDERQGEEARVR